MQIWVGLGNPGAKYALHRHNVGFMAVDAIAEVARLRPWQKKFRSLVAKAGSAATKSCSQARRPS
jgi:peptidyl-tRNA hydrolase, PTH1 family